MRHYPYTRSYNYIRSFHLNKSPYHIKAPHKLIRPSMRRLCRFAASVHCISLHCSRMHHRLFRPDCTKCCLNKPAVPPIHHRCTFVCNQSSRYLYISSWYRCIHSPHSYSPIHGCPIRRLYSCSICKPPSNRTPYFLSIRPRYMSAECARCTAWCYLYSHSAHRCLPIYGNHHYMKNYSSLNHHA